MHLEQLGLDLEARLVGGRRAELAQMPCLLRIDHQTQLFEQFTGQGADRLLIGLDLAARLHEGLGTALAYQQGTTLRVDQQGGGDAVTTA